jgi:hypothetical protein
MVEESIALGQANSKYRFGKITNKYLIIELYAFSYLTREEAIYRMFKHGKLSRQLLIEQYKLIHKLIPHELETININFA